MDPKNPNPASADRPLAGQAALVTGGARGLGAAICDELARAGANVVVTDLDGEGAGAVARQLVRHGVQAVARAIDVSDPVSVMEVVRDVRDEVGDLDVIVNNAGVDVTSPIDDISVAAWQRVLMTNLFGPYLLCHEAIPMMKARGRGHIVNITSTAAKRAWPNASAYHASKWGLLGLSHALHAELRAAGVRVSAIVAGGMRTPFLLERFPDIDESTLQPPEHVAAAVRFVLTQPPGTVIPEVMVLPLKETSWP